MINCWTIYWKTGRHPSKIDVYQTALHLCWLEQQQGTTNTLQYTEQNLFRIDDKTCLGMINAMLENMLGSIVLSYVSYMAAWTSNAGRGENEPHRKAKQHPALLVRPKSHLQLLVTSVGRQAIPHFTVQTTNPVGPIFVLHATMP